MLLAGRAARHHPPADRVASDLVGLESLPSANRTMSPCPSSVAPAAARPACRRTGPGGARADPVPVALADRVGPRPRLRRDRDVVVSRSGSASRGASHTVMAVPVNSLRARASSAGWDRPRRTVLPARSSRNAVCGDVLAPLRGRLSAAVLPSTRCPTARCGEAPARTTVATTLGALGGCRGPGPGGRASPASWRGRPRRRLDEHELEHAHERVEVPQLDGSLVPSDAVLVVVVLELDSGASLRRPFTTASSRRRRSGLNAGWTTLPLLIASTCCRTSRHADALRWPAFDW